ncbi:HAD family hydrolase [Georgenia wutianyii]|uniref:HAD family hydrolase n=2 Tax=Georgenia wutianyii TaxID=2585135 RepID=A0ABX5VKA5_9MICO|nr:HAD family hydrolase [Georgenia wutianyii]
MSRVQVPSLTPVVERPRLLPGPFLVPRARGAARSIGRMTEDPGAARALLHTRRLVVLDFDGPVTRLLPGEEFLRVSAGALDLAVALGLAPDDELTGQTDHVQLLRLLSRRDPAVAREVERWCTAQEVAAARSARPVEAAASFVARCRERGTAVAVVTNNAPEAVRAVLAHGGPLLAALAVHGRDPAAPERLKPAPDMLLAAARDAGVHPDETVMVGDSTSDVEAATAAGMPCIGLSDSTERRAELIAAGAVAVVADLTGVAV